MKMHPFIYQQAMACANADGYKSETRRNTFPNKKGTAALATINKAPLNWMLQHSLDDNGQPATFTFYPVRGKEQPIVVNTGIAVGDTFYQRESCYYDLGTQTWRYDEGSIYPQDDTEVVNIQHPIFTTPYFETDRHNVAGIHMPQCAARYFGEITGIYAEPLQMITEVNAIREGILFSPESNEYYCDGQTAPTAKLVYQKLWESIYTKKSWKSNPWVIVIRYKQIEMPGGWPTLKIKM
jgi:hypothetical protein